MNTPGMDRAIDPRLVRTRRLRRVAITAVCALTLVALFWGGMRWLRPSVRRDSLRTARVERGPLEAIIRASGEALPAHEEVLASPVDGRVLRKLAEPGASLVAGQRILELDVSEAALELERLDEARDQLANETRRTELTLAAALSAIERQRETKTLDHEIAEHQLTQHRTLAAEGLVSESALREAEVRVEKAGIELRQLDEQAASERAQHAAKLESLALDARIKARERAELAERIQLAETRALRPGVLTFLTPDIGTAVRKGDVLARIAEPGAFRVEARISDAYAARLAPGQRVRVRASGELLDGRLSTILPTIEDGALGFTVTLDEPSHPALRQRLRVEVFVVTGHEADTLRLPRGPAIKGGGLHHQVFVVDGERALRRDITLGLVGEEHFALASGLEEGDEVVLTDLDHLMHARELRLR